MNESDTKIIKFIETINTLFLIIILVNLILIFLFKFELEKFIFILDVLFVFLLVSELVIKYFHEKDKEFIKEHWLEILSLLPILLIFRVFYFTGLLKSEKEIEATNTLVHTIERFGRGRRTTRLIKIIYFIERRPIIVRTIFRILLNLKKLRIKKSAFSLDLETIIKFIILILFLGVITLMIIKLKNSKVIFYLINW